MKELIDSIMEKAFFSGWNSAWRYCNPGFGSSVDNPEEGFAAFKRKFFDNNRELSELISEFEGLVKKYLETDKKQYKKSLDSMMKGKMDVEVWVSLQTALTGYERARAYIESLS